MKVDKVWGHEEVIINNEKYCGKILYLKKGYFSSLHYHREKDETFHILKGKLKLETGYSNDPVNLSSSLMTKGSTIRLMPNTIHRFTGISDTEILEVSTHHEDSDTFRLKESGAILSSETPRE